MQDVVRVRGDSYEPEPVPTARIAQFGGLSGEAEAGEACPRPYGFWIEGSIGWRNKTVAAKGIHRSRAN